MRIAVIAVLLAGCASTPRMSPFEAKQAHAARLPSPVICYVVYAGNRDDKLAGEAELEKRGFQCTDQDRRDGAQQWPTYQAMEGQRAQSSAADDAARRRILMESGLRLLTPPPVYPTRCTTDRWGNTTCF